MQQGKTDYDLPLVSRDTSVNAGKTDRGWVYPLTQIAPDRLGLPPSSAKILGRFKTESGAGLRGFWAMGLVHWLSPAFILILLTEIRIFYGLPAGSILNLRVKQKRLTINVPFAPTFPIWRPLPLSYFSGCPGEPSRNRLLAKSTFLKLFSLGLRSPRWIWLVQSSSGSKNNDFTWPFPNANHLWQLRPPRSCLSPVEKPQVVGGTVSVLLLKVFW
jgi:hypothetical protein